MEKNVLSGKQILRIILCAAVIGSVGVGAAFFLRELGISEALSAYTIQTNLFCLTMTVVTLMYEISKRKPQGSVYSFFKGMALVSILLTCIITYGVLRPSIGEIERRLPAELAGHLLHLVVPLLILIDFILFEEKGHIKPLYPLAWTAYPLYYVGYVAVYRAFGGLFNMGQGAVRFPYFFLDYETYGFKMVGLWILIIMACFLVFSYILFGLDRIFVKIKK